MKTPCPGQTCTPGTCPALIFATATPPRNYSNTMHEFQDGCDKQRGCIGCALYEVVQAQCTPGQRCVVQRSKGVKVAVLLAKEFDDDNVNYCFTNNHWMVVPTRVCIGIEVPTRACTGPPAERYWAAAWSVAMKKGFDPSGRTANGSMWGVLLNPANGRSQHQTHLRIAAMVTDFNSVVAAFQSTTVFSTDISQPTVTPGDVGASFASVFIKGSERRIKVISLVLGRCVGLRLARVVQ